MYDRRDDLRVDRTYIVSSVRTRTLVRTGQNTIKGLQIEIDEAIVGLSESGTVTTRVGLLQLFHSGR